LEYCPCTSFIAITGELLDSRSDKALLLPVPAFSADGHQDQDLPSNGRDVDSMGTRE
jgi:hypothetical protein